MCAEELQKDEKEPQADPDNENPEEEVPLIVVAVSKLMSSVLAEPVVVVARVIVHSNQLVIEHEMPSG